MRVVVALAALVLSSFLSFAEACQGCGCRGGPGYRGPNGKCVGWKQLNKVCGSPPTTRCTAEGPALSANRQLGFASMGESIASEPVETNLLHAQEDGIGCRTTAKLKRWQYCAQGGSDCGEDLNALVDGERCVSIQMGTPVEIEASSRSFDWLRIRVPGVAAPVWTERSLILGSR